VSPIRIPGYAGFCIAIRSDSACESENEQPVPDPMLKDRLNRGIEALNRADFPSAIEILSEVVVEDSENAEAWRQLGVCYLETAQPDLAMEALTRAVRYDSRHASAHYLLGNAYGSGGQLERAAACYRRALEIEPGHAKAEEFLMRTESLLESREHYKAGLKLLYVANPTPQDLNRALRELVQSTAIFPGSPARDNLLVCGRKLLAFKTEWTLPADLPRELETWATTCERGFQCVQFGNWVGARAAYNEALSYRVQDAFVHHALGFTFVELGELDDAVRAWLRVLELNPEYDFTHFGRLQPRRQT
jgi:tetratricopeptide (TPR) repeat protein